MPKNVMKLMKPSPNLGRNAFDMSFRNVFSCKFGELLPAYCQETVPNDSFEIRPADLVRALPLVTSPFLRAKQHIDFWFVPYNLLWSRFNEFIVDKDEVQSSASKFRTYVPSFQPYALQQEINQSTYANETDVVGQDIRAGIAKVFNLLGYGDLRISNLDGAVYCNLFRALAYQYIWYKEYRQQYYDDAKFMGTLQMSNIFANVSDHPISCQFNADWLPCDQFTNSVYNGQQAMSIFQMRYRLWKKDLFTGLLPSTQFGNVSVVTIDNINSTSAFYLDSNNWPSGVASNAVPELALKNQNNANQVVFGSTTSAVGGGQRPEFAMKNTRGGVEQLMHPLYAARDSQGNLYPPRFDILALRKSEAIQKWRENALRAGNFVEDNFEAHYGSKPQSHLDTHPKFLGSFDAPLNVGDVDATAQTGTGANQQLGSIAGKGISTLDGRTIKFSTNDFGVIIGMFSLLPEAEYNAVGADRMNCLLEREDFFIPEYENLGLAPVDRTNFIFPNSGLPKTVIGYAPRYWEYKQRIDKCYDQFINFESHTGVQYQGMFRYWTAPKYDIIAPSSIYNHDLGSLYVDPKIFDVMFGVSAGVSDQFLVDMFFDATAVRSMSVSGMPSY